MNKTMCTLALAACLSACGGGGGSAGSGGATLPAQTMQLGAYLGTWGSDCASHGVDTVVISRPAGSTDSITIAFRTDYYANADCSGGVVATWTQSADVTATYAGTADTSIVPTPGAASVAATVDKVTVSLPQHTATVTGPNVVHTITNGQAQWCINYANGDSTCIKDEGTYPAQSGVAGGLYLQGNTLYELVPSGTQYAVDERFTRK